MDVDLYYGTDVECTNKPRTPHWMERSACLGADTDMFFSKDVEQQNQALAICGVCPVVSECLEFALSRERDPNYRFGIWGGTKPTWRISMMRERRRAS